MSDHRYVNAKPGAYQSQHGEDAWLEGYFGHKTRGFYVEVGAYDGKVISNTYYFEQLGWTGALVEPHPEKAAACRVNRPRSRVFECAAVSSPELESIELMDVPGGEVYSTVVANDFNLERLRKFGLESRSIRVPCRTLDSILDEMRPQSIDFVSIDVEGAEIEVLRGFDIARWRPQLVLVESPPERLDNIRDYFVARGYAYRRSIDVNDIYEALPASLPWRDRPILAATLDHVRYRTCKALTRVRASTRVRTRLRARGLWP